MYLKLQYIKQVSINCAGGKTELLFVHLYRRRYYKIAVVQRSYQRVLNQKNVEEKYYIGMPGS